MFVKIICSRGIYNPSLLFCTLISFHCYTHCSWAVAAALNKFLFWTTTLHLGGLDPVGIVLLDCAPRRSPEKDQKSAAKATSLRVATVQTLLYNIVYFKTNS